MKNILFATLFTNFSDLGPATRQRRLRKGSLGAHQSQCNLANWPIFLPKAPRNPPNLRDVPNNLRRFSPRTPRKSIHASGMKKFWDNQSWSQEAQDLGQYTETCNSTNNINPSHPPKSPQSLVGKESVRVTMGLLNIDIPVHLSPATKRNNNKKTKWY